MIHSIAGVFHGHSWPYSFMWSGHFGELRRTGHKGIIKKVGRGAISGPIPTTRFESPGHWKKVPFSKLSWLNSHFIWQKKAKILELDWRRREEERNLHFISLYLICSPGKGTWTWYFGGAGDGGGGGEPLNNIIFKTCDHNKKSSNGRIQDCCRSNGVTAWRNVTKMCWKTSFSFLIKTSDGDRMP